MKIKSVRTAVAVIAFVALAAGLILGVSFGTLSGFGWEDFTLLCPLGALATMIASKTFLPRALISIVIMALLVLLVGRAFCSWLCPVSVLDAVKNFFRSPKKRKTLEAAKSSELRAISEQELTDAGLLRTSKSHDCSACGDVRGTDVLVKVGESSESNGMLRQEVTCADEATSHHGHTCSTCGACGSIQPQKRGKLDSRHAVLGGALLSTAVFGFPVFCLVCPVGLTFATVLVVWRLFSAGDMTWSVLLIPALLVVELVLLRKWCTRFCPLSALMNLVSRFSKTWVPVIDDTKCLETAKGTSCSRCALVCDADINLRHPEFGERGLADCTRCHNCVDACPTQAVSMPFRVRAGQRVTLQDSVPAPVMEFDDLQHVEK